VATLYTINQKNHKNKIQFFDIIIFINPGINCKADADSIFHSVNYWCHALSMQTLFSRYVDIYSLYVQYKIYVS